MYQYKKRNLYNNGLKDNTSTFLYAITFDNIVGTNVKIVVIQNRRIQY